MLLVTQSHKTQDVEKSHQQGQEVNNEKKRALKLRSPSLSWSEKHITRRTIVRNAKNR